VTTLLVTAVARVADRDAGDAMRAIAEALHAIGYDRVTVVARTEADDADLARRAREVQRDKLPPGWPALPPRYWPVQPYEPNQGD
jgi:shikimate 5-dehydrogenase